MKIAFLSSSFGWGGLERNLVRYGRWMTEIGHEIEMNCLPDSPLADAVVRANLPLRLISRQPRYFPWREAQQLKHHLMKSRIDILWIRDPRDLPLAAWATKGTWTDLLFHQGMQMPKPKKNPWQCRRFRSIDIWVSPLDGLKHQALKNTCLRENQTHVIPLALDDHWFETTGAKAEARKQLNLSLESKIVGLFGRFDRLKGQDALIRALAEPEATSWQALFIGENTPDDSRDAESELKALAEELGVSDRIHWRGPLENLLEAYDACDAYAMCSVSETFGMVTIEAMARQIPVCGTNAGGTPELLKFSNGENLVEPGDFKGLARWLQAEEKWTLPSNEFMQSFHKQFVLKRWERLLQARGHSAS